MSTTVLWIAIPTAAKDCKTHEVTPSLVSSQGDGQDQEQIA